MAKYTFTFDANLGGVLRPFVFRSDFPGTGLANQYVSGKVFGAALKGVGDIARENMNAGLNDYYGRPVFSDLILQRSASDTDRVELMNALVTVEQKKNIVQTSLSGRNGSVIEYVSMPSYDVTIEGKLISNEVDSYPKGQVEALIRMLNDPETLEVVSDYLAMFSIYNLVISTYTLKQEESSQGSQKLTVKAISDELLELVIE